MKLLWLYLLSFLIFPIIGEFIVMRADMIIGSGSANNLLIISNIIFVMLLLVVAYSVQNYKFKKIAIYPKFSYFFAKKVINRSIPLLIFAAVIVFMLAGRDILFRVADRGEIRVSLGMFSILYKWITLYLTPAILLLNSIIYLHLDDNSKKGLKTKMFFLYFLSILVGLLTGYKATFVIITIGGLVVLTYKGLSLKKLFLLCFTIMIGLVFTTIFVRNESNILIAFNFLINRMTVMAAYGTVGLWNAFPSGAPFSDYLFNFFTIFGNKIASLMTGYSVDSIEFLKINLSRLITYMVYPDTQGALKGTVNVTVTNFGEAIYFFGRQLFIVYALTAGIIIGIIIRKFKKCIMFGLPIKGALFGVYFFTVVISWVNSSSIGTLISLPVAVWLFLTYITLYLITKARLIRTF